MSTNGLTANQLPRPEHGGRLRAAAKKYDIPLHRWLDLSTGINPQGWPVPGIPAGIWQRLPEENDGLAAACEEYFQGCETLVTSGSQAALQALPTLRSTSRVAIVTPCYGEHVYAWRAGGHWVDEISVAKLTPNLANYDVVVLCNPNNPTGLHIPAQTLLDWHYRLAVRGGWLVVDEAFADANGQHSLLKHTTGEGLIVLRSLGKFFGLAGLRVGFVAAHPRLRATLAKLLGPWAVSNPARWITRLALQDQTWQEATRKRLQTDSKRLADLLERYRLASGSGCALFRWVNHPEAAALAERLAQQGVLVRSFAEHAGLRFGLPGEEGAWRRLEEVLAGLQT